MLDGRTETNGIGKDLLVAEKVGQAIELLGRHDIDLWLPPGDESDDDDPMGGGFFSRN